MSIENPTRRQEAMRYWLIMRASAVDMPFSERRDELRVLALHCRSDVLREVCKKNFDSIGRRPVRQRLSEKLA